MGPQGADSVDSPGRIMHGHWPRSACLPVLHFAPWKGQVYSCPLCVRLGGSWADCSLLTGTSYLSTGDRTSGLALLLAAERANLSLFLSLLLSAASCAHSLYKPRFLGQHPAHSPCTWVWVKGESRGVHSMHREGHHGYQGWGHMIQFLLAAGI